MVAQGVANSISTVSVADYTRGELIIPRLREKDAAGIINELSHVLLRSGVVPDVLPFYHAALNQELMANSGQQCGLAFPHGRLNSVRKLQFAFGRTPEAVSWGPRGSWPVRFVFLLAVPSSDAANYLPLLGSLARMGQSQDVLSSLEAAANGESILNLFRQVQLRQKYSFCLLVVS